MVNIKGFAIRGLLKYLKEHKPGSADSLIAGLPPEQRAAFDEPISLSQWYPYEVFAEFLKAIHARFGHGDRRLCVEIGDFAARQDITGIFKVAVAAFGARVLVARAQLFWSKYCDTGKFSGVIDDRTFELHLEGFPMIEETHCYLLIGWIRRWGLMMNIPNARVEHTSCVRHGAPACTFSGSVTG